jgi:hypothetical protein
MFIRNGNCFSRGRKSCCFGVAFLEAERVAAFLEAERVAALEFLNYKMGSDTSVPETEIAFLEAERVAALEFNLIWFRHVVNVPVAFS